MTDVPSGPAEDAGIKAGDVILKLDGRAMKSLRDVTLGVARLRRGVETGLEYRRGSEIKKVTVKF